MQVVGESYYAESFLAVCGPPNPGGRSVDRLAELRPQPDNPYDEAAVAVFVQGWQVGHLSREDARRYGAVVRAAIAEHGTATCPAVVHGGWSRSNPDDFIYWVRLDFSDGRGVLPPAEPDEFRLPTGGSVSVSNEQEYQDALIEALGGWDLSKGSFPILAELATADANPHVKASGQGVAVQVNGRTVGFLTSAMSEKYLRAVKNAEHQGKRARCEASLFKGFKGGQELVEIRLHLTPYP